MTKPKHLCMPDIAGIPLLPSLVYSHQLIGFTQVRADCTVTALDISKAIKEAAEEIRPDTTFDGFRPGKSPIRLIISKKWEWVEEKARHSLIDQAIRQIQNNLGDPKLAPIAPPQAENEDIIRIERIGEKGFAPLHFTVTWPIDARQAQLPGIAPDNQGIPGMPSAPAMPNYPGVPQLPGMAMPPISGKVNNR